MTASREKLRSFHPEVDYSAFEDMADFSYDDYIETLLIVLSNLKDYAEKKYKKSARISALIHGFIEE